MNARRTLVADAVVLAAYAVAANPAVTGIPLHEWVSLAVVLVALIHLGARCLKPLESARSGATGAARSALDLALLVSLAAVAVSGVMVSGDVLPSLGLFATGYFFWGPLHATAAKVLLALILVHLAVHARWIVGAIRCKRREAPEKGGSHVQA